MVKVYQRKNTFIKLDAYIPISYFGHVTISKNVRRLQTR